MGEKIRTAIIGHFQLIDLVNAVQNLLYTSCNGSYLCIAFSTASVKRDFPMNLITFFQTGVHSKDAEATPLTKNLSYVWPFKRS